MKALLPRALLVLGALGALVALVLLVVDAVRGSRSGLTTALTLAAAGAGVVLVLAGVATAGRTPRRPDLRVVAAAAAVVGVVAAAVLVLAVPRPTLERGVVYDTAEGIDLTLTPPDGVVDGDLLVATVYRRGAGALRVPPGWAEVRTSPLGDGSLVLLTRTADGDGDRAPATFSGDTPGTLAGGISAYSNADGVTVSGEQSGGGAAIGPVPAPEGRSSSPTLVVVALDEAADVTPSGDTALAWRARIDGPSRATIAVLIRPGGTAATVTATATPAPAAWVAQGVELTAG